MSKTITLVNVAGKIQEVKIGGSVTTFFFGVFPDLLRGNFKSVGIYLVFALMNLFITPAIDPMLYLIITFALSLTYAFIRNKYLLLNYIDKGYKINLSKCNGVVSKDDIDKLVGFVTSEKVYEEGL